MTNNEKISPQWDSVNASLKELGSKGPEFYREYFSMLKRMGLPPIVKNSGKIFIIESIVRKDGQFFVSLSDGKFYHGSFIFKIPMEELVSMKRSRNIEEIFK